jgi:putative membrane protein
MVADHKDDIRAFEKESRKNDPAGSYAKETLPTLRKHLQAAESLQPTTTGHRTR